MGVVLTSIHMSGHYFKVAHRSLLWALNVHQGFSQIAPQATARRAEHSPRYRKYPLTGAGARRDGQVVPSSHLQQRVHRLLGLPEEERICLSRQAGLLQVGADLPLYVRYLQRWLRGGRLHEGVKAVKIMSVLDTSNSNCIQTNEQTSSNCIHIYLPYALARTGLRRHKGPRGRVGTTTLAFGPWSSQSFAKRTIVLVSSRERERFPILRCWVNRSSRYLPVI